MHILNLARNYCIFVNKFRSDDHPKPIIRQILKRGDKKEYENVIS